MDFTVPAIYKDSIEFLEKLLADRPKARIVHILSHEQRSGFHLVVNEDGSQYTDDFGMEVYIAKTVDWQGGMNDIDEREQEKYMLPF